MQSRRASRSILRGCIDILVNVAGGSGPIGKTGWETSAQKFNDIVPLTMSGCFNTGRRRLGHAVRSLR